MAVSSKAETSGAIAPEDIEEIAELLANARSALFITGAGISADSGLPTYRGIGGLYNDAYTEDEVPIEEALSGDMLLARPDVTWKYMSQIETACRGAQHNRAHEVIAALEERMPRVWVLTQNVDGFHRDAGSHKVIEIHGNLRNLVCTACDWDKTVLDYSGMEVPPTCPRCGGPVRPAVVLFGEMLPTEAIEELDNQLEQGFDIVFSIGTTSVFPYISQPVIAARILGTPTVEINPADTEVSELVDYRVCAGAKDSLEALWQAYWRRTSS